MKTKEWNDLKKDDIIKDSNSFYIIKETFNNNSYVIQVKKLNSPNFTQGSFCLLHYSRHPYYKKVKNFKLIRLLYL